MPNISPTQHETLAGKRFALFGDGAIEISRISAALVEHGAVVDSFSPDSQWWLRDLVIDVAIVRIEHSQQPAEDHRAAERGGYHLLQTLAQTERVIGLLDEPPAGVIPGLRDFVLPPFRPDEVIPRIVRVLGEPRPSTSFLAGNLELNPSSRTVLIDGSSVDLTFHEFEILRTLLAANGAVLTRDDLSRRVWGGETSLISRRMDIHIHRLRAKLAGLRGATIDTVRNVGYRLTTTHRE